jgi:dipeptidyl aminopeptidase/acylaminoacyl peptidase
MWQMDGAGTPESRVRLPDAPLWGDPSYLRYGNKQRWFLYDYHEEPAYPKFPNGRYLIEIRAGSEGGEDLLLLSDPNLEIISHPRWSAGDASITFIAERWSVDAEGQPIALDAGVYELSINFTQAGIPQVGTLEFVADLSTQLRAGPDGTPTYFCGHSCNSTGTQLAFAVQIDTDQEFAQELWIVDLSSGTSQLLMSGVWVWGPEWSPDDTRIGLTRNNDQVVYNLATGRTKLLNRTVNGSWWGLKWSPTGDYVVVSHWDNFLSGSDSMYRFTAELTGRTELTAGLPIPHFNDFTPVGWRE